MIDPNPPLRSVRSPGHLVASADQIATTAGVSTFAKGGNAVDAAIATNAAIAVVGYSKFTGDARETEAHAFLTTVAAKQDQYNSRFGTFVTASANPGTVPSPTQKIAWDRTNAAWIVLGARPKKTHVSFQYETRGGAATTACTQPGDLPANSACAPEMANRNWWWAIARNSTTFVLINSERGNTWTIDR